jgi:hypothetical protein
MWELIIRAVEAAGIAACFHSVPLTKPPCQLLLDPGLRSLGQFTCSLQAL